VVQKVLHHFFSRVDTATLPDPDLYRVCVPAWKFPTPPAPTLFWDLGGPWDPDTKAPTAHYLDPQKPPRAEEMMARDRNDIFGSVWLAALLCRSLTAETRLRPADGSGGTSQQPNLHPAEGVQPARDRQRHAARDEHCARLDRGRTDRQLRAGGCGKVRFWAQGGEGHGANCQGRPQKRDRNRGWAGSRQRQLQEVELCLPDGFLSFPDTQGQLLPAPSYLENVASFEHVRISHMQTNNRRL